MHLFLKAPERNPQSIKIQGHLPHQMDISWEVRKRANLPMKKNESIFQVSLCAVVAAAAHRAQRPRP